MEAQWSGRRRERRRCAARVPRRRRRGAVGRRPLLPSRDSAAPTRRQIYTRRTRTAWWRPPTCPTPRDFRLTYPGKGTLIHSRGLPLRPSYNGEFNHHIEAAAATLTAWSVDLVRAVIQVESEFDQLAVSSKGAQGLMQLMPFTARALRA